MPADNATSFFRVPTLLKGLRRFASRPKDNTKGSRVPAIRESDEEESHSSKEVSAGSQKPSEASKYIESAQWHRHRRYRNLILRDHVVKFHIRTNPSLSAWLYQQLEVMGQEVDSAIFDLRMLNTGADEFFKPYLATTYTSLVQLMRLLMNQYGTHGLQIYLVGWTIRHWLNVCRLHLLRSWLFRAPRRRLLFGVPDELPSLHQMLQDYVQTHALCCINRDSTLHPGLCTLQQLVNLPHDFHCQPCFARELYMALLRSLCLRYQSSIGSKRIWIYYQRFSLPYQIVLLEAQSRSTERLIGNVKLYMDQILGRKSLNGEPLLTYPVSDSKIAWSPIYDRRFEECAALAGFISLLLVLLFLLLTSIVESITPISKSTIQFEVGIHEPLGLSIRNTLMTYFILAPFCVYLNFELRLRLMHMLLAWLPSLTWSYFPCFPSDEVYIAFPQRLFKLGFEINLTWRCFEHYEQRLLHTYQQLLSGLAARGILAKNV
ncbi:hypothetical protein CSKR_110563 [Clonorchis sinensis]|uniref:Uncharacterized protein n=1 Tax=Clonorchis sinensis TaxID=79923 RepID=A0A419Q4X1_CLOSI|nr:hypothetical protein CSKR_110563 [Clonorchis sinensis]